MFKTTIQLPLGDESGEFTIQVPMNAFQNGDGDVESTERLSAFSSKITAAILEVSRKATKAQSSPPEAAQPQDDAATISLTLRDWDRSIPVKMKRSQPVEVALGEFARKAGLPALNFVLYGPSRFSGGRVEIYETPDSLGMEEGDVLYVSRVQLVS